jgi:hypothetical protein
MRKDGMNMKAKNRVGLVSAVLLGFLFFGCEDLITPMVKEDVRLAELPERTLTILTPSNGSCTPVGVIKVKDGEPLNLVATANTNFVFDFWQVTTGATYVNFGDDHAASTDIRLSGGNATISATFADTQVPTGNITIPDKILVDGTYYLKTKAITVNLSYNDNVGVTQMKLAESTFATGTPTGWVAANTSTTYTFASDGVKTLYVRFKDGDGNESSVYSAGVKIDSTGPVPTKYQVDQISPAASNPLYVTSYTSSNLQLTYLAGDGTGSGVAKVYFSNNSSKPGAAQVDPYIASPPPYAWTISAYDMRLYYTVYFWFEDKLGNLSGPFTDNVRYDDKWEGYNGNNTIDATSGATIIVDGTSGYGTTKSLLNIYSPSYGYAYLNDADWYKWGFTVHDPGYDYPAQIVLYINAIITANGDFPLVSFYDSDGNDVTPDNVTYNIGARTVTYDFTSLPYVDTGGYEYYFYAAVERASAPPYLTYPSYPPNYNLTWYFNESGGM